MELFYSTDIADNIITLSNDEYRHCCKVLRNKIGDKIHIIDGVGNLFIAEILLITSSIATARILEKKLDFGGHKYHISMAVAPTKSIDRYEWFLEKATEMGLDNCYPIISEHSERRVVKVERLERVVLSAVKQSLKGYMPKVSEPLNIPNFLKETKDFQGLKLIAYCGQEYNQKYAKKSLTSMINKEFAKFRDNGLMVMIGPEGDFSPAEVTDAINHGFMPISLGNSRLRTETAALFAVSVAYMISDDFE